QAEEKDGRRAEAAADRAEAVRLAPRSTTVLRDAERAAAKEEEAFAFADRLVSASESAPPKDRADALMERGNLLRSVGRLREAERDYLQAQSLAPDALYAREQLVLLALDEKRDDAAEARARELVAAAGPGPSRAHAAALALRAKVLAARGRQKESDDDFLAALAEDPSSNDEIRARMGALSRQGYKEKMLSYARRLLDEAAAAPAGDEDALKTTVDTLEEISKQGRTDAALPYDVLLSSRVENTPPPARGAGFRAKREGPDMAAETRRRAAVLLEHLGRSRAEINDFPRAEADFRAALAAAPRNFDVLCTLTQFLRERGRYADSLAVAQVLATVTEGIEAKNRAEKWLQRAETLMRLGRYDESVADVRRALADKPGDVPSLWLMAQVLLRAGRAKEALPYAEKMLAAATTPAEKARALSQRAQVRDALGDSAGARADADAAVAVDPSDHVALEARVQRLRAEGRLDEALTEADKMVAAGSDAPPTRRAVLFEQRAQVKRLKADRAGAEADLRAALAVEPDAASPLRALAEVLLEEGRTADAVLAANRYLTVAAESTPILRAEGRMLRARALAAAGRDADAAADRAEALRLAPSSPAVLRDAARSARSPEEGLALAER
ncbi:MAG: tetratricopeptide repeat protein, partial [Elusimicrobia bacterium]|nr:tetratricopeptide repeat protein [Elusimicrobiota bacterium]